MALTFDYKNCNNDLLTDEHYKRTVEYVVFRTMILGMPKITEENWSLFVMRCFELECAQGYVSPYTIKEIAEKVYPWIGLHTNATPLTDAAFAKKMKDIKENTMRIIRTEFAPANV